MKLLHSLDKLISLYVCLSFGNAQRCVFVQFSQEDLCDETFASVIPFGNIMAATQNVFKSGYEC